MSARNGHAAKAHRRYERKTGAERSEKGMRTANAPLVIGALIAMTGHRMRVQPNRSQRRHPRRAS